MCLKIAFSIFEDLALLKNVTFLMFLNLATLQKPQLSRHRLLFRKNPPPLKT